MQSVRTVKDCYNARYFSPASESLCGWQKESVQESLDCNIKEISVAEKIREGS